MKTIFFLLALILLSGFAPDEPAGTVITLPLILAILAGCYEVISRLIKTSATWSIIGKVLEVLTWLSNLFDRKRK
jgi:hypothetical protein